MPGFFFKNKYHRLAAALAESWISMPGPFKIFRTLEVRGALHFAREEDDTGGVIAGSYEIYIDIPGKRALP